MIRIASSLTNRIFLASTLLATLSLGFAFAFVNARASAEVEAELRPRDRRGGDAGRSAPRDAHRHVHDDGTARRRPAEAEGRGRDRDPPTVQPAGRRVSQQIITPICWCSPIPRARARLRRRPTRPSLAAAQSHVGRLSRRSSTFLPHARGLLQVVSVPILIGPPPTQAFSGG